MKKSVVLLATLWLSLIALSIQAQQNKLEKVQDSIVPLEQFLDFKEDETLSFPDNPYFKDIDNDLDKYVGVWKGSYYGKEFELHIAKYTNHYSPISMDALEITYKISRTVDNSTIASTLNISRSSAYNIVGRYLSKDKSYYSLYYMGYESNCGQNGYMSLRTSNSTDNTLQLKYFPHGDKDPSSDCTSNAEHFFPITKDLVLSKQKVRDSIVPLVRYLDFLDDETDSFPRNSYFKDVDNDLDKYIGVWKGNYDGKEFEIHIAKYHNSYAPISIDELEITYKITKTSDNTIVASTLDIDRSSPYNVVGEFLSRDKTFYSLYYMGYESKCGQNAYIGLRTTNSKATILNLKYTVHGEKDIDGCAQTATHIFPTTQGLVLSKQ